VERGNPRSDKAVAAVAGVANGESQDGSYSAFVADAVL
jgi:hypothetical protein